MPVAVITGGSRGLGRALADELAGRHWDVIITGRNRDFLAKAASELGKGVIAVSGDVATAQHRAQLAAAVSRLGALDLLVNNASVLGPSPLPRLEQLDVDAFAEILSVNAVAPLAVTQDLLPYLRTSRGMVVNISSDAGVEAYEGWGGYGASKAALDHLSAVLAVEEPLLRVYSFDPGDMRTDMHQAAFPGEDITDRPLPEAVAPKLLALLDERPPSGRYAASSLAPVAS